MTASRINHPPADAEWIHDMESEDQPLTTDVFGSLTFTGDVMLKRLSEDVYKKLQQTMQQGLPLDPAIANSVLARLRELTAKEEAREVTLLSQREMEVVALVARGLTNREIAAKLIISQNTARNHVSHILDKLGLTRRSEAATFAAQHGLLGGDGATTPPTE